MNDIALNLNDSNPALVASNVSPAMLLADTVLAEDTIIGTAMDILSGKATTALFANPINNGMEEMLYIDENQALRWIRHSNGATSPGSQTEPSWVNDTIDAGYSSVVVAVHPTGAIWAFAITTGATMIVQSFALVADVNAPSGAAWVKSAGQSVGGSINCANLSVQYLNDRPATPLIFFTRSDGLTSATLNCIQPQLPVPSNPHFWFVQDAVKVAQSDISNFGCVGKATPSSPFYLYVLDKLQLQLVIADATGITRINDGDPQTTGIIGICSTKNGPSCLAFGKTASSDTAIKFVFPTSRGGAPSSGLAYRHMDQPLEDACVWQDSATLLHIYGRGGDGGLYVIHQSDWLRTLGSWPGQGDIFTPIWDQHVRPADDMPLATSRALVAKVASYRLDAYPDAMPDQHIMHSGADAGEACAFYKQSTNGAYWAKEKVRIVPQALPAPYKVKRYQTVVTAKSAYGSAMGGLKLTLTASEPVDLQVDGKFYRPGPLTPIHLTTSLNGKVILRVMAEGLHQPNIHVSAAGVDGNLTINPAAGVQKFISGSGPLPNHPDGFTPQYVENAKNPDGSEIFPGINRSSRTSKKAGQWPPSAADLVDFCQSAFAVQSNTLMTHQVAASAPLAISFQMHDPSRPGYEIIASKTAFDVHRVRLESLQRGDGSSEWLGDLTQGIRSGLVKVSEVFIDVKNKIVKTLVTLADGVVAVFQHALEFIHEAAQAVESVVVAVGAKIHEFINALAWLFEFKDVWDTKAAFESGMQQALPLMQGSIAELRKNIDAFLEDQIAKIDETFNTLNAELVGQSLSPDQIAITPDQQKSGGAIQRDRARQALGSGHASWLTDHLSQAATATDAAWRKRHALTAGADDNPIDELISKILNSPGWDNLYAMVQDFGTLAMEVFSVNDPNTVNSTPTTALLDFLKELMLALLNFAKSMVDDIFDLADNFFASYTDFLNEPVDLPLLTIIYNFLQDEVGIPSDRYEVLTYGRLGFMLIAFPGTLAMKVIAGHAPFPGGKFPDLTADQLTSSYHKGVAVPGPIPPTDWLARQTAMMLSTIYQLLSIEKEVLADVMCLIAKPSDDVSTFGRIHAKGWGIADLVGSLLQTPALWGLPILGQPGYSTRAETIWSNYGLGIASNALDILSAYYLGKLTGQPGDIKNAVVSLAGWTLDASQLAMRVVRYLVSPNRGHYDGNIILAANILDSVVGLTAPMRFFPSENAILKAAITAIKMCIDAGGCASSAILTMFRYGSHTQPKILNPPATLPAGKVGVVYPQTTFHAEEGSLPYTWSAISSVVPPVSQIILPPGLAIDPKTGILSGTPTKQGTYSFAILLKDFFVGPAFGYQSEIYTIVIEPDNLKSAKA